jgi:hypothetical protein
MRDDSEAQSACGAGFGRKALEFRAGGTAGVLPRCLEHGRVLLRLEGYIVFQTVQKDIAQHQAGRKSNDAGEDETGRGESDRQSPADLHHSSWGTSL